MGDAPHQDDFSSDIEGEVNSLIAEAQALSSSLAEEVGADEVAPTQRESEFFESRTDSEASLDTQMAQADAALREATEELGSEPPPAPKKTISLPPKKAAGSTADTKAGAATKESASPGDAASSQAQAASSNAQATHAQTSPPRTDAAPKTITLPPRTTSPEKGAGGPSRIDKLVAGKLEDIPFELEDRRPGRFAQIAGKLKFPAIRNRAEPALHGVCSVLEALDRPFQKVGDKHRTIIGWVALAIAVAAFSLYFFAVL